jgi:ribosomal protein S18 acetylase RimI-like enzyme
VVGTSPDLAIDEVRSAHDVSIARALFREYAAGLDFDLAFQDFARELAELPGAYAPPSGRLFLARTSDQVVGCVGFRNLGDGIAEMKRLYVRPARRGTGAGRILAATARDSARALGYTRMRLDTVPAMEAAIGLYISLGFRPIAAYCVNPIPGARFFELAL